MSRVIFFNFLLFAFGVSAQPSRHELINRETNQWLQLSSRSFNPPKTTFTLITKRKTCVSQPIIFFGSNYNQLIDSLKANGWTQSVKYRMDNGRFEQNIELKNITFKEITFSGDSLFQFIYQIAITDTKLNLSQAQLDTLYGTEKQNVLDAFAIKSYEFEPVRIQKGTGIILVYIVSPALFNVWKEAMYTLLPLRGHRYLF